jgi:hypothetical protein
MGNEGLIANNVGYVGEMIASLVMEGLRLMEERLQDEGVA